MQVPTHVTTTPQLGQDTTGEWGLLGWCGVFVLEWAVTAGEDDWGQNGQRPACASGSHKLVLGVRSAWLRFVLGVTHHKSTQ